LTTSNAEAAKAVTMPQQIRATRHPAATMPAELARLHEESKTQLLAETPDVQFVPIHTMDEYTAAQDRQQAIKAAFREGIGYLDPEEVRRIAMQKYADNPEVVAMATVSANLAQREEQAKSASNQGS
jgi:hypothetical protein